MARVPLGPWRPDAAPFDNTGLVNVRNAVQAAGHWRAQPGLANIGEQTFTPPIQGLFTATRSNSDRELFVSYGGELFRITGVSAPVQNVSDPALSDGYSTSEFTRWRFVQFEDLLIATNFEDEVQAYSLTAGGTFGPLADPSGECPQAKYLAVVKGFVTLAYTRDEVDGEDAFQVRWHGLLNGLPDPYDFTRSVDTQADSQRLAEIGVIAGITGGEFGTIVGEGGVVVQSLGSGTLFRFDVRERRLGCRLPNSIVQYRQLTFWWSPQGVVAFDGQSARLIGVEKIDRWLQDDFDEAFEHKMWTAIEFVRGHVLWLYCGKGHTGEPNRLLRYSVELDEWSVSDFEMQALGTGRTFGRNLEDDFFANLEDPIHTNLEDPALFSSFPQTVGVAGGRLVAFGGPPLTGTFETGEFTLGGEDNRVILRKAMVRGSGGTSAISFVTRDRFRDAPTVSGVFGEQADGWIRFRVPGRSHRTRIVRSGSWVDTFDVNIVGDGLGKR